jgi:hypothetical protein
LTDHSAPWTERYFPPGPRPPGGGKGRIGGNRVITGRARIVIGWHVALLASLSSAITFGGSAITQT